MTKEGNLMAQDQPTQPQEPTPQPTQPTTQPTHPVQPAQPTAQPTTQPKRVVKWDKGVDYIAMYHKLKRSIIKERYTNNKCYAALALVILRNGLRLSEGVEAFKAALQTNADIVEVRTRKKKKLSFRKAKIPDDAKRVLDKCRQLLMVDDRRLVWRFMKWLRNKHKINPHSLRYSFVTYAATTGLDSALIARAIDHSRIDQLDAYVQKHVAAKHVIENDLFEP